MGAVADGGGILHILVGLSCLASVACVDGALMVGAGVRVGVFIPIAHFGHVGFTAFSPMVLCA